MFFVLMREFKAFDGRYWMLGGGYSSIFDGLLMMQWPSIKIDDLNGFLSLLKSKLISLDDHFLSLLKTKLISLDNNFLLLLKSKLISLDDHFLSLFITVEEQANLFGRPFFYHCSRARWFLWTTIFYHFDASSLIHFLVVTFDILDLLVTCIFMRILVYLHSSKSI